MFLIRTGDFSQKSAIKFYSSHGMSVKNMKLEKILSTSDVEQENISINITSNVKVEKHQ